MEQNKTPLYEALIRHKNQKPISLHVPGHKNGGIFPLNSPSVFNNLLSIDVTELTGLDDLHSPEGVILQAQELLAKLYQTKMSFFLVNGTTVGNLAMISATLNKNDTVIVQRNCHKSILNGLRLAGANPVFIEPEYDEVWRVAGEITVETVRDALTAYPDAKAIILTYPNYYGMVYDLKQVIELAHKRMIPVLVDEAHGAHFIASGAHAAFPKSAVTLGADIVVQSAHKTLPAMTMGSYLHFNSELVSIDRLKNYLHMFQSSSPSYPIMASLDLARYYLATYTDDDLLYLKEQIKSFRDKLALIPGIKVLDYKTGEGDLLKITIQSKTALSGYELQGKLADLGIYAELADPFNVLLVAPLLKSDTYFPFSKVISAIREIISSFPVVEQHQEMVQYPQKGVSKLALSFSEIDKQQKRKVPFKEAIGKIAAEMVVPYPPGIPLFIPGELITAQDIVWLEWLIKKGTNFQGGEFLADGFIYIY